MIIISVNDFRIITCHITHFLPKLISPCLEFKQIFDFPSGVHKTGVLLSSDYCLQDLLAQRQHVP